MEVQPAAPPVAGDPANPVAVGPPPPARAEGFFAITKSLIIRALIIYFITSMFRRPSVPVQDPSKPGTGVASPARLPSTQLYANGTVFDLHVYISEDERLPDFNDPTEFVWMLTVDSPSVTGTLSNFRACHREQTSSCYRENFEL